MPGTLTLRPLSAKLTRNTELFGTMDPYCKIVMGKQKVQSEVCTNGGKNPHWESSYLVLKRINEPVCEIEIKEKDWLLPDGTIGVCRLNIDEVEKQKRVLKWYPVSYKEHPVGQILIEASYEADNIAGKNVPISQPQNPVQQTQPQIISGPHPLPQVAPMQQDFRQPDINQEQRFPGGHVYGYNPLNQAPHNIPQTGFNQNIPPSEGFSHPVMPHEPQGQMYAPPMSSIQQDANYPQKYPQLEPHPHLNQFGDQNYGYQQNPEYYNNENQGGQPYAYDSRPVTDFPVTIAPNQNNQKGFDPMDLIRGSR